MLAIMDERYRKIQVKKNLIKRIQEEIKKEINRKKKTRLNRYKQKLEIELQQLRSSY